jgi:MtN3 and saliva related transmembrane protein
MSPFLIELIGALAATTTTLCWAPQAWRIIRTRETRAISLASQAAFAVGLALWLVYGLLIGSWPIIVANVLTLILVGLIIAMKLKYG